MTHTLARLNCAITPYDERIDQRHHVDQVKAWAAAACTCGHTSHAYLWIEQRTMDTMPDAALTVLERCGHDALHLHNLHIATTREEPQP